MSAAGRRAAWLVAAFLACRGEPGGETDVGSPEASGASPREGGPPRILVTNDDGIESPGLTTLARALAEVGEVTVVAPCSQRSGSSMAVALAAEVRLRGDESVGYCVDATPAGAVLFAFSALGSDFDLVVSGINRGANVGDLARMSGTVGAAMAGAYLGAPAVASSQGGGPGGFEFAAGVTARFAAELLSRGGEPGIVYSINFPSPDGAEGIAARPMGGSYLRVEYERVEYEDRDSVFAPVFGPPHPFPEGSDSEAWARGLVTITPLRFDWTDYAAVEALETWDLERLLARQP